MRASARTTYVQARNAGHNQRPTHPPCWSRAAELLAVAAAEQEHEVLRSLSP
jgi:hypothetical protein